MKCPWKHIKTVEKICDGNEFTKEITEFGVCDMKQCPYFGINANGGWCRRVAHEVGACEYCEVK